MTKKGIMLLFSLKLNIKPNSWISSSNEPESLVSDSANTQCLAKCDFSLQCDIQERKYNKSLTDNDKLKSENVKLLSIKD
jgi:hypothetical protein